MFEQSFNKIVDETNLFYDDRPHWFEGLLKNTSDLASWKTVEECINNPQFYDFELIGQDGTKKDIPAFQKAWVTNKAVQEKSFIAENVINGDTLIITNYGFHNRVINELLKTVETIFDVNAAAHLYCGREASKSFSIHEDYPANFICQIEGRTRWQVYNNRISSLYATGTTGNQLTEDMLEKGIDIVLNPGDVLYIPSRAYHVAVPEERRISVSIPCWNRLPTDSIEHLIDRNYYTIDEGIS